MHTGASISTTALDQYIFLYTWASTTYELPEVFLSNRKASNEQTHTTSIEALGNDLICVIGPAPAAGKSCLRTYACLYVTLLRMP